MDASFALLDEKVSKYVKDADVDERPGKLERWSMGVGWIFVSVRRRHLPLLVRDRSDTRLSKQERSDDPEGCECVVVGK